MALLRALRVFSGKPGKNKALPANEKYRFPTCTVTGRATVGHLLRFLTVAAAAGCVRLRSSRQIIRLRYFWRIWQSDCFAAERSLRQLLQGGVFIGPCVLLIPRHRTHPYLAQSRVPQGQSSFRGTSRIPPWCAYLPG